jgi:hypothetical protein
VEGIWNPEHAQNNSCKRGKLHKRFLEQKQPKCNLGKATIQSLTTTFGLSILSTAGAQIHSWITAKSKVHHGDVPLDVSLEFSVGFSFWNSPTKLNAGRRQARAKQSHRAGRASTRYLVPGTCTPSSVQSRWQEQIGGIISHLGFVVAQRRNRNALFIHLLQSLRRKPYNQRRFHC